MTAKSSKRPKAYSYLRFSTPEQMQGNSFQRQTEAAQAWADRHGIELADLTFRDLGISAFRGKNAETGALRAFRDAVESGEVPEGSYLLVEALDRISRQSARKASRVLEEIVEAGVYVVTLSDEKVWDEKSLDSFDWIMANVLLFRGNEESQIKSRRVKAAWKAKRQQARESRRVLTAKCPAWLQYDKKTKTFHVIEERAEIVRRVFKEYLAGDGYEKIARALNKEGVPTFGNKATHWRPKAIHRIIQSPSAMGTLIPHVQRYEDGKKVRVPQDPIHGYYPAVVDEEVYRRAEAMAKSAASSGKRGIHAKGKSQNLFSGGLIRCGRCGGAMTRTKKGVDKPPYLVCRAAKNGGACKYDSLRYDQVEETIRDRIDWLISEAPSGEENLDLELENVESTLMATTDALEKLLDALQATGGTSQALRDRLETLEAQREELETQRRELLERRESATGEAIRRRLSELKEVLSAEQQVDREQGSLLMKQVFREVVMDFDTGYLVFHWHHGGSSEFPVRWVG